ncbi:DoxX family protein [Lutibacter sp. TH_r2]|uniref:DoxX family protein n=1 Tax=Lutibacter sp. TH_r2 TaxID=3082083 RepID=UPI002953ED40|nr:DoxX family protein [Lutibacter sp. TH_r2]MDV7186571.1 DoxX family protein [Lutibacter sp. TH_r2]
MEVLKNDTAEILIIVFFIITYFMSVFEKIADWKGTKTYYKNHFQQTFLFKFIPVLLLKVVVFELVTLIFLTIGLYFIFSNSSFEIAKIGLIFSAITLLFFLLAQRIAKDYPGAMNITVYFILNCFGIFLLT